MLSVKFCPDTSVRNALTPLPLQSRDGVQDSDSSSASPLLPQILNQGAVIGSGADIFLSGICQASASSSSLWKSFSESVGNGMVQGQLPYSSSFLTPPSQMLMRSLRCSTISSSPAKRSPHTGPHSPFPLSVSVFVSLSLSDSPAESK
jgi:hypothetical protein